MKRRMYRKLLRPDGQGIERLLGELEGEIMRLLWTTNRPVTVRDVLGPVNAQRDHAVAYTTVMTVMARLAEKGLLERTLVGNTHEYRVAQTREEFLRQSSAKIVSELVADFGDLAIASFVETLGRVDPNRLYQLREYLDAAERRR